MSKEQQMFALIGEFERGELNGRDFCKDKGVVPSTFYYWKKKKAQREAPASGFIAVRPGTGMDGSLELIYPNGVRLRLEAAQFALIGKLLRLY
ncbi:MAG: IS66 family insertion sequence element accessory protein TnpB [Flavobacteriaceae bacterium]|nr:IS66 family insertion sequence element accessory protein TnpB [Flavobacteriaceae bacterium]